MDTGAWIDTVREVLGCLFVVSGLTKLVRPHLLKQTLLDLGFSSKWLINIVPYGLPPLELVLGGLLAIGFFPRLGCVIATVLLIIFTTVKVNGLLSQRTFRCACFGGLASSQFTWWGLAENFVMIAMAIFVAISDVHPGLAFPSWKAWLLMSGLILVFHLISSLALMTSMFFE